MCIAEKASVVGEESCGACPGLESGLPRYSCAGSVRSTYNYNLVTPTLSCRLSPWWAPRVKAGWHAAEFACSPKAASDCMIETKPQMCSLVEGSKAPSRDL